MTETSDFDLLARADEAAKTVLARIREAVPDMTDQQAAILQPALSIAWAEGWYAAGDEVRPLLEGLRAALMSVEPDRGREAAILRLVPKEPDA